MELTKKQNEKLTELNNRYHEYHHNWGGAGVEPLTDVEKEERHELTFRKNLEQTYGLRLQGGDKYYYANQIKKFIEFIQNNGSARYLPNEIKEVRVGKSHYCYEINIVLSSGGVSDFKRFDNIHGLFGFIEGYNSAKNN
jgi:hypothetical protein